MVAALVTSLIGGFFGVLVALINRKSEVHKFQLELAMSVKRNIEELDFRLSYVNRIENDMRMLDSFDEWYAFEEVGTMNEAQLRKDMEESYGSDFSFQRISELKKEAERLSKKIFMDIDFFRGNKNVDKAIYSYKEDVSSFFYSLQEEVQARRDKREVLDSVSRNSLRIGRELNQSLSSSGVGILYFGGAAACLAILLFVLFSGL
nr:hypothetical protein BN993_03416 [Virgibacillus halodenitrificans]